MPSDLDTLHELAAPPVATPANPLVGPGFLDGQPSPGANRPLLHGPTAPTIELWQTELPDDWDEFVSTHPLGTVFHKAGWRRAVVQAFQLKPLYLVARSERIVGALPLFLVPSRIAGRMLVSVPYAVGGGILANDAAVRDALTVHALELAREHDCKLIDLRSEEPLVPNVPVVGRYLGFQRDLPGHPDDVLSWLPRKARAVVRHAAERHGLRIRFGHEHLPIVWRLYARNMRRLSSLAYPLRFLSALTAHAADGHWTCVVERNGIAIAGLVTFLFGKRVLPYFFGAESSARRCGAANFLYFRVMQRAAEEGFRVFDFGRSRADNQGSVDFKRFQGFEPRPLGYQVLSLVGTAGRTVSPSDGAFRGVRRLWPYLPMAVTNALSSLLCRHLPG